MFEPAVDGSATRPRDPAGDPAAAAAAVARDGAGLEQYRNYLTLIARAHLSPRLRDPVDVSGIVQQTFLEAHRQMAHFRGGTAEQMAAWLRQILAHNLADALRGLGAAKRDLARQRSLEDEMARSSVRHGGMLAADGSSPSAGLRREERAVQLADALATLPEAQREALILQYWHGHPLADIAARLDRTPAAVAGLLKRGLKQLRSLLNESPASNGQ
jgi:RNA polymerase sigma-70 factor, ECF subfamily